MAYVEKTQTWDDNWNNVIRRVFFKDNKLKEQMLLPDGITITQFIDKYFIEDISPDEIVTDEKVRIAYYDTQGGDSGNKNVKNKYKELDIYVKSDVLHNASRDRLKARFKQIEERIKYLLLREDHVCGLHFEFEDSYDLWTKVIGYKRYHVTFSYKITV